MSKRGVFFQIRSPVFVTLILLSCLEFDDFSSMSVNLVLIEGLFWLLNQ